MVIVSLVLSMSLIFFLVNKKINIGFSLFTGAIVLALINRIPFEEIIEIIKLSLFDKISINLVLAITFITVLGYLMDHYKIMDRMIYNLEVVLRSAKVTIMFSPALVGTLLITGGALMSCPIVDKLGDRLNIEGDKKAAINLVYRHGLYFIFPLSSTFILATQIADISLWDFVKIQFPIALALYVVGYYLLLRDVHEDKLPKVSGKEYISSLLGFLYFSSPISISLLSMVAFDLVLYVAMLVGLITAYLIYLIDVLIDPDKKSTESVFTSFKKGFKPTLVITIIGIMIFKNTVNSLDEIYILLENLISTGIPVELIILISTAILAFSLASMQPSVIIMLPLILPLAGSYEERLLYTMFIYTSSFVFYYFSPLHMCQVLTLDYFKVKINDLYRNYRLLLPVTYAVMVIVYFINKIY